MKKFYATTLFAIGSFLALNTNAQDLPDSNPYTKPTVIIGKEMGVRIQTNGSLDFSYIKHKENLRSFRFRTCNTGFMTPRASYISTIADFFAFGGGGAFGLMKMRKLDNKFVYYHGWEPFVGGYISFNYFGIYTGIGHVFGLSYDLSEKFNLNMELVPSIGVSMSQLHNGQKRGYDLQSSSTGLSFSLHYKISK